MGPQPDRPVPPGLAGGTGLVARSGGRSRGLDPARRRYGERWAQHWLDLAHYADSNGFELDAERPDAWRYRDWVVKALNADLPYDRFLMLQVAGDDLQPND